MKRMKAGLRILVLVCVFALAFAVPSLADTVDQTPAPTVTIDYNVSSHLASMTSGGTALENGHEYYVYADTLSYSDSGLLDFATEPSPTSAYWKIVLDGSGNRTVEGLYPAPGDLVEVSSPAVFSTLSGAGNVDGIDIKFAESALGYPVTPADQTSGNTAVFYGDTYYVYTANDWAVAEAKVNTLYYESFAGAVAAANFDNAYDVILLRAVTVDTSITVNAGVDVFCCNGSGITVASGGSFYINGGVYDNDGSERVAISLTDGGDISDFAANIISATLTAADASVTGTNTVLTVTQAADTTFTVNINGSFADLEGQFFALTNNTSIAGTGTGSASITGGDHPLTVNGGTVYVSYAMTEGNLKLSAGDLWLAIPSTEATYVTGISPYAGNVHITSGTAWVLGSVNTIHTYGASADETGGTAKLIGTAASATVEGNSVLIIENSGSTPGQVTPGDVTGVRLDIGGTYIQGVLRTTDANTTYAKGTFERIEGGVTMSGDLTVMDASALAMVTGNSNYSLEIFGSRTMDADYLKFSGTFRAISIHNINVTLGVGLSVNINEALNLFYDTTNYVYPSVGVPVMTIKDGVRVGGTAIGDMAAGTIQGIVNITNSAICGYFTGEGDYAEFHIDEDCYTAKTSFVGVAGEYRSLTGRACTFGDLIVHSTVESTPVYVTSGGVQLNSAVITGGMTRLDTEYVNGYGCSLTLDDAAGNTTVELYGGDFQYIEVYDDYAARVSLTMYDGYNTAIAAVPVAIGSSADDDYCGRYGLFARGDAATVVTLLTDDIYGFDYGVYLCNLAATITGSDENSLKTITVETDVLVSEGDTGVYADNTHLVMANYGITGKHNGVTMVNGSLAELTNAVVSGGAGPHVWGVGILVGGTGDAVPSTLNLRSAAVTGDNGINVNCGSTLRLSSDITVTGAQYGIKVTNGTVTNEGDDTTTGVRTVTADGTYTLTGDGSYLLSADEIFAMYIETGTVTLDGYTFTATALANGSGFVTGNGTVAAVLSDDNGPGSSGAYIWGSAVGVSVGSNTTMTVSDYNIYGADKTVPEDVLSGTAGVRVYGELRLSGVNTILGGQYGIWSVRGTVTNFMAGGGWTTNEQAQGAAPQGSGSILTGPLASATALRAEGGTVTLGAYQLISIGVDTEDSCGLYATKYENGVTEEALVYLCGDPALPAQYSVKGGTGAGVRVNEAYVTIYNMELDTKSAYSAQVDSGVLNLGTGVTLHSIETAGVATVRGTSGAEAELHVIYGNTDIGAQGSFNRLTGFVGTTNDLTIIGTDNANAYSGGEYRDGVSIMGGGAHDLMLGTDSVYAVLVDNGVFASVKVTGTSSVQQGVMVSGNLTVTNSDMDYGISAAYADVRFRESGADPLYVRSITASGTNASALEALVGAKIYLADMMTFVGNGCGLYLNSNAVVTDMKEGGVDLTAYSTAGTPVSGGSISATTSTGVCMEGSSVLLLGGYGISGPDHAIDICDNAAAYFLAGDGTNNNDQLSASAAGNTIVCIDTTKWVTISGYTAEAAGSCAAAVRIAKGTVTLDGGYYSGELTCPALVVLADQGGTADVTLTGAAEFLSGMPANGSCVSVAGTGAGQKALLSIEGAQIASAAESGVLIGPFGEVSLSGGRIIGEHLDSSEARYGARLTDATSVFNMSGGTIGFKDGITVSTAGVYAGAGSVAVSDGIIGVYSYVKDSETEPTTVFATTGIYSSDTLAVSGGFIYGANNALDQSAGNAWISGGTLDSDNYSEVTDTVILTDGRLWLTGGTVNGVVFGKNTGNACLYINPVDDPAIWVGGTYASMTGNAKVNGIGIGVPDLTIGSTTDALNLFDGGHYANGTAEAYDRVVLTGEAGTTRDVSVLNGTAEIAGDFGALTVGDEDDAADAEVTAVGNVSLSADSCVASCGLLIIPENVTVTITDMYDTLTVGGTVTSNGTIVGTVTGDSGTLTVANADEAGTNVNVRGTFAEITGLNRDHTFTLVGNLTVNGTREESEDEEAGFAYVIGNNEGGLTVADVAVVYAKGVFGFANGPVILWGDTTINGTGAATITKTAAGRTCELTVGGTAAVALDAGSFSAFTVNGGTLTLKAAFSVPDVSVTSGSLVMTDGKLYTNEIIVGDGSQATMNAGNASYLEDTLTVSADQITLFPAGVAGGTYKGWYVSGGDGTLVTAPYTITGGEILRMSFEAPIYGGGGGSAGYDVNITLALADGSEYPGTADRLGTASVTGGASAGSEVTLTVTPGTSFAAGSVTAQSGSGVAITVTDNGDGTFGFSMPSDNVEISVEFVPLLGEPQTTPEIEYAVLSPQTIYLNGEEIDIMAYNVNGNNYFKLRDIAYYLNGTGSQFAVDFTEDGLVILATGEAYVPVGGEAVVGEDQSGTCVVSSWSLQTDGVPRYLKCYNIAGNNFFQLRELGELLGFGVSYDEATDSVHITTE